MEFLINVTVNGEMKTIIKSNKRNYKIKFLINIILKNKKNSKNLNRQTTCN